MSNTLYDEDFFARAKEQARLLRAGKLSDADIEHIAEESRAWAGRKSGNW